MFFSSKGFILLWTFVIFGSDPATGSIGESPEANEIDVVLKRFYPNDVTTQRSAIPFTSTPQVQVISPTSALGNSQSSRVAGGRQTFLNPGTQQILAKIQAQGNNPQISPGDLAELQAHKEEEAEKVQRVAVLSQNFLPDYLQQKEEEAQPQVTRSGINTAFSSRITPFNQQVANPFLQQQEMLALKLRNLNIGYGVPQFAGAAPIGFGAGVLGNLNRMGIGAPYLPAAVGAGDFGVVNPGVYEGFNRMVVGSLPNPFLRRQLLTRFAFQGMPTYG